MALGASGAVQVPGSTANSPLLEVNPVTVRLTFSRFVSTTAWDEVVPSASDPKFSVEVESETGATAFAESETASGLISEESVIEMLWPLRVPAAPTGAKLTLKVQVALGVTGAAQEPGTMSELAAARRDRRNVEVDVLMIGDGDGGGRAHRSQSLRGEAEHRGRNRDWRNCRTRQVQCVWTGHRRNRSP